MSGHRINLHSLILLAVLLPAAVLAAEDQTVTLPDGNQVILHDDFTWEHFEKQTNVIDTSQIRDNGIPAFLRRGIRVDRETIAAAVELYSQGWKYTMPRPKSKQAAWGNTDGRTTWWNGYWTNERTSSLSMTDPRRRANGIYYGDAQDLRYTWRNGGSPQMPTKLEWLFSESGGVPPE